uniref:Uncharacterized protein n=1 Tax=Myotis myotis TaxID=51298 RepID=A0A7J7ZY72_MYOMY|nr:hypothetical protein mMyoMyo1_009925 [Myotis myotis]
MEKPLVHPPGTFPGRQGAFRLWVTAHGNTPEVCHAWSGTLGVTLPGAARRPQSPTARISPHQEPGKRCSWPPRLCRAEQRSCTRRGGMDRALGWNRSTSLFPTPGLSLAICFSVSISQVFI